MCAVSFGPAVLAVESMMAKKLSMEEILKAARAQASQPADSPSAADAPAAPTPAASEPAPATVSQSAPPAAAAAASAAPSSTKDILAAARAQSAGAAQKPAAPAAGGAPKSTADILAAARAQSAAGAATAGPAGAGASGAKSTKDILAAARAQSGTAPAAPAKTAGDKPVRPAAAGKSTAIAVKAVGERPSVEEMLKAAREGRTASPTTEVAVAAKPAAPTLVIPQRPAPSTRVIAVKEPRRGFLARTAAGLAGGVLALFGTPFRAAMTSFTGTMGVWTLGGARFMMPNVLVEPPSKFKVGPASDYAPSAVSTKWTPQYGVWLVRNDYKGKEIIYALQTVCTHLGCTPNWLEGERKFKCPCHGSGFYITGINFEGPAPRPLERMAIRLSEDGMLEVDKSRKFQEELGQWEDPASFVEVA